MVVSLLQICHECDRVQPPPYNGRCACTVDGVDIIVHSKSGECPLGRFPKVESERAQVVVKLIENRASCIHKSSSYVLRGCPTCGGNVQVKLFECTIHGRCSVKRVSSLIQACVGCPDFKIREEGEK